MASRVKLENRGAVRGQEQAKQQQPTELKKEVRRRATVCRLATACNNIKELSERK
jgi:hypothetical protein